MIGFQLENCVLVPVSHLLNSGTIFWAIFPIFLVPTLEFRNNFSKIFWSRLLDSGTIFPDFLVPFLFALDNVRLWRSG